MALGFEQAGFDVVCAVERDPAHAAAHRFNFPQCDVLEQDAASVAGSRLRQAVRDGLRRHGRAEEEYRVDVVFGGPPCQGFSVGGQLDPHDPRNQLVKEFARLVVALKPSAFVLENVPAMATRVFPGEENSVPHWLARRFALAGYDVALPAVLNASHFGLPQDRRRLLVVGVRRGQALPSMPRATHAARPKVPTRTARRGEHGHSKTMPALPIGPSVRDAISDLPDLDEFDELLRCDAVMLSQAVRECMQCVASPYARLLSGLDVDESDLSWPRRRRPSRLTSSLRTVHGAEVLERFSAVQPGEQDPVSRLVRLHFDGISPTLRAGSAADRGSYSAPRPIHPKYDRVISVREAARLHGFPDWFRFSAAKWHGFRQVGNAVCPPLAKAVAESVRQALQLPAEKPQTRLGLGDPNLLLTSSAAGRRRRDLRPAA